MGLAAVETPPEPQQPKKGQRKKSKPKPKPKAQTGGFSSEQLTALFVSMSSIAASRPGMEMWQLSEMEAKQLADPLANMIARSEKLQAAGEYADAFALVTAAIMIFVPRFMMWAEMRKQKKIAQNGGAQLVRKETKGTGSGNADRGHLTPDPTNDAQDGLAAIPLSI